MGDVAGAGGPNVAAVGVYHIAQTFRHGNRKMDKFLFDFALGHGGIIAQKNHLSMQKSEISDLFLRG